MAAGIVSKPGDLYGHCTNPCEHLDCVASRLIAACLCRICSTPIGYEIRYYDEWYNQANELMKNRGRYAFFVHAECLEKQLRKERI